MKTIVAMAVISLLIGCEDADGKQRQNMLQIENSALRNRVTALENEIASFRKALELAQGLTNVVSITDEGDIKITGANLQIVNGIGKTFDYPGNGKGNLIIGYNEQNDNGKAERSGSHCVVVGAGHSYRGSACLVAGRSNTVDGFSSSVLGGAENAVRSGTGVVVGGENNLVDGARGVVVGGHSNQATGVYSVVTGGSDNVADTNQVVPISKSAQ